MTAGSAPRSALLCVAEGSCDGQGLVSSLNASGMQARLVPGSTDWSEQGQSAEADLLLLAISEPGLEGLRSLQRLAHSVPTLPVIVLSADPSTNDLVTALAVGAEDYLPWPCPIPELLARIRAVLRRTSQDHPRPPPPETGWHLDEDCRQVWDGNQLLPLSPLEYRLLRYFLQHPGQVLRSDEIVRHIWGPEAGDGHKLLKVPISRLRRKTHANHPDMLVTVRGIGYVFQGPNS